jgi:RhtB (resistance to homoserine/threonine) family protein
MFLEVFLVGLLAGISPGPDFAVVMKNSLTLGRPAGRATALGIAAALIIHVSYTILGFAIILEHQPKLFRLIQLAGAAYLVWLGWHSIRSGPAGEPALAATAATVEARSDWNGFWDGFLCNALNPKAPLFFLSIFAQFLTPGTPEWVRWIYGLETIAAVGGWFVFLSHVISSDRFRQFYGSCRHWFDRALGAVLLYFAFRIGWSVFRG